MKTSYRNARISDNFVLLAIQEWGQSEVERIKAVQEVLTAAKFDAQATCWPIFGGIWPKKCAGNDGEIATDWLKNLCDTMCRGNFNNESRHVLRFIEERQSVGS